MRRRALILGAVFLVMLFAAIFLLPSFILSQSKAQNADAKATTAVAKSDSVASDLPAQIEVVNKLVATLKPEQYALPSSFVDMLTKDKTPENTISFISYARDASGAIAVSVNGVARRRQSLVAFTDNLGKEPGIGKIDVPVSNFTKDTDISFSFTISIPTSAAPKK